MTKSKFILFALFACVLSLGSCKNDVDGFYSDNGENLSFVFVKSDMNNWTSTKAEIGQDGSGSFVENDKIGLVITSDSKSEYVELEYKGGKWLPELRRSDYGGGDLRISAHFPVLSGDGTDARSLEIESDQSNVDNYGKSDVLYATATVGAGSSTATLSFKHALHRININLSGTIPQDLSIQVRSILTGSFSLTDGASEVTGNSYEWITPYRSGNKVYSVIVLPQTADEYKGTDGLIKLSSGGKDVIYQFTGDNSTFDAGKQTTVNLNLKSDGSSEDVDFANKKCWVYGITSPEFPGNENLETVKNAFYPEDYPVGTWFREDYTFTEAQYLTWQEGCGWFDCNKSFNYEGGDGNMCWAAAASNLIHWWMDRNKKYIEAYDNEYGQMYSYARPEKYEKMTEQNQRHSEVFNFFKDHYLNLGSWDTGGVNWFINGDNKNLNSNDIPDFHGFFSNVFSKDHPLASETKDMRKDNFNACMKDAFSNNKAICFSCYGFTGEPGSHSMTIWGAEFDENGDVSYIYISDNNLSENEPLHACMKRYMVIYKESSIPEVPGETAYFCTPVAEDGSTSKPVSISSLTTVDLGRDIWETKYPSVIPD